MKADKPEILAPAGNTEALEAALKSGADAVYVGGERFSARNSAANFTAEELEEAVRLCHLYGAKLYLAVNTIISDEEADDFCHYIKLAARIGVDAFIVQDWGCAYLIRKCVPDAVLHASTQMSVHTACGAGFLKNQGFSRVVPARELDKAAIEKICKTGIETEIFVHGALCMSVSGQCYMSAVMGSRSANRGCCGQACRLPFSAVGNKNNNALSLKDLSLIPVISQVKDTGTCSLKIEGRMKRPEYVASAVDALKTALDGGKPDMQALRGIFSRGGFTDGYFTGKRSDMFGIREKNDVTAAQKLLPKTHELYRFHRKTRSISFHAVVRTDTPVSITAFCGELSAEISSDCPQTAINRPTDLAFLEKQLSKLGDTVFSLDKVTADIDDGLAVSAGKINELRRALVEKISDLIISRENPNYTVTDFAPTMENPTLQGALPLPVRVFCRTIAQAKAALPLADFVILDENIALSEPLITANPELYAQPDKIIISPPRFICDEERLTDSLRGIKEKFGFTRLMCHTPDCIAIGKKLGFTLHGGFGLNVFNSFSADALAKLGLADFTVSFEAKLSQINRFFSSSVPIGGIIGGRLPLMVTKNCPIKNEVSCKKCTGKIYDRTGRGFPVVCKPGYTEILNCSTLFMQDKPGRLGSLSFGIIMLSDEDFSAAQSLIKGERPCGDITNGLYQRGIL